MNDTTDIKAHPWVGAMWEPRYATGVGKTTWDGKPISRDTFRPAQANPAKTEYRDSRYIEFLEFRAEFLQDESNDIADEANEEHPDGLAGCPTHLIDLLVAAVLARRAEMFRDIAAEEKLKPALHLSVVKAVT